MGLIWLIHLLLWHEQRVKKWTVIAAGQVGNLMFHTECPCNDTQYFFSHPTNTKCKKCSNKLPSILPSISKIFTFSESRRPFHLQHLIFQKNEKKFWLKKYRSLSKCPPSGYLIEAATQCSLCDTELTTDNDSAVVKCRRLVFVINIVFMSGSSPPVIHCHIYEVSYYNTCAAWSHAAVNDVLLGLSLIQHNDDSSCFLS